MKTISVCKYCGSPRVRLDAVYDLNTKETFTYDHADCIDCGEGGNTLIRDVEVPDDFDLETDTYDLNSNTLAQTKP